MEKLSDYEQLRLDNIKKNEEFLKNLGLSEVRPPPSFSVPENNRQSNKAFKAKRKVNSKRKADESTGDLESAPVRRSTRSRPDAALMDSTALDNLGPDRPAAKKSIQKYDYEFDFDVDDDGTPRKKISPSELREIIAAASAEDDKAISDAVCNI